MPAHIESYSSRKAHSFIGLWAVQIGTGVAASAMSHSTKNGGSTKVKQCRDSRPIGSISLETIWSEYSARARRSEREARRLKTPKGKTSSAGFSLIELVIVVAVILLLAAIAIPNAVATLRAYRMTSSARGVAHQLSLARLRAETEFTNSQLVIDPATNSYNLQVCSVAGGKADNCTTAGDYNNEGTQFLPSGISFGFGPATVPAGGQAALQQTLQTRFNSRGIPVLLDGSGNTNANDVIYVTDGQANTFAVSVTVGGHVRVWRYNIGAWHQQ